MHTLSIVIPCYNNADNIADLQATLEALSKQLSNYTFEVILVDDGSKDETHNQLLQFSQTTFLKTVVVKLTGNFGSYNAFLAGLHHGSGDVYAHMHPDMQDPPKHLIDMLPHWENGIKYVIAQRVAREDKNANQLFAKFYHWLMKRIALPHIPAGGYDLIVFDKELRNHVVEMNEQNVNLVYLISWLQYPYVTVPITRISRDKGKSQWTFSKKSKLLFDSIVAFSYTPVRYLTYTAMFVCLLSIPAAALIACSCLFTFQQKVIIELILLFGNLLLIAASVIGEYVWRTLDSTRNRPPFIVDKVTKKN